MYNKLLILLIMLMPLAAVSQESNNLLHFEKYQHYFGIVRADRGDLWYSFKFTNKSDKPVVIKNVTATCGCTVPHWTKDTIYPDSIGNVDVLLKINKLGGYFNKAISVFTNIQSEPTELLVSGRVYRNYAYDDVFQNKKGALYCNYDTLKIVTSRGELPQMYRDVLFINVNDDTVAIDINMRSKYLKASLNRTVVIPGSNCKITLKPKKLKKVGTYFAQVKGSTKIKNVLEEFNVPIIVDFKD